MEQPSFTLGEVTYTVTKLGLRAWLELEDANKKIIDYMKGMPALLFTKEDPFKIYKIIQKAKTKGQAKAGQTAPNDIIIPAGPTSFAPGPIIGELGAVGIKAGIDGGKVAIKQDSTVAKEGQVISAQLAGILSRLDIRPMDIGLNVTAVYENGTIYTKEVLGVDEQQYIDNVTLASQQSINLAVHACIFNSTTTELILGKAFNDAKALAIVQGILSKETVDFVLARAQNQMLSLKSKLNI